MKKNAAGNILAAFLSACVLCGAARASGGENTLSISPSFVSVHRGDSNGFTGAQLKYRRGIDDFYNFFFSGTFARTLDEDAADKNTFFLNAGFSYFIDVVNWVPEIMLGAGIYSFRDKLEYSGVFAGLALDYRRWKTFSIGAEACYHFLFQDQSDYSYPRILSAALRFGFYW